MYIVTENNSSTDKPKQLMMVIRATMFTFLSFKIFIYMCGLGGHNISGHLPQKVQLQTACKTGEKKTAEKKNN